MTDNRENFSIPTNQSSSRSFNSLRLEFGPISDVHNEMSAEKRRQLKCSFQIQGSEMTLINSTNSSLSNSSGATAACPPISFRPSLPLSLPKLPLRPRSTVPADLPDKARDKLRMCQSMQSTGKLQLSPNVIYDFTSEDLQDLGEIGRGGFGTVNKMIHRISDTVMAVKRIRSTVDEREQKQLLMDLEVVMKSNECPCIVQFYGALFKEGDCWICMELMDTSLDIFYKFIHEPERIDPQRARGYDVRSDVWSLGITLMEIATGYFPYPKWNSVFEQLYQVVQGDPPRLSPNENGNHFTMDFVNFVNTCLIKEETQRPKYNKLLEHPFIRKAEEDTVDVAAYISGVLDNMVLRGLTPFTTNRH
ncbi:dual specificity mitogen-activated protein kinase kinase 4 isoform X2 [Nomia melanderi]|uniref:dual specificity mitogen-activated protein kinase kinase 4 isoform X2 n=1 Tax=Nomia melanderi TaxID=2448451 RepID=UPI001304410C|nr:dual specificity mitogen-activated protein kinase kinase 2 isoform X2 [Nomia melanderi]